MAAKFGTSGLRGLVEELEDGTALRHARAFARHLLASGAALPGATIFIGRDLRGSSPEIARQCMAGIAAEGLAPVDCGVLPTPALASHAMGQGAACLMVTGSHIPADRNGVKFYRPDGEIDKADEAAIAALAVDSASEAPAFGQPVDMPPAGMEASSAYIGRYRHFIADGALAGRRIGIYEHSTVARDLFAAILAPTGAAIVPLARSDHFIPVDTEAVTPEARALIRGWTAEHRLDALISADGDGDRPLLSDETGECLRGDLLGLAAALHLGADAIVTPVTSNSGIEAAIGARVWRTRVGSPFVIEAMTEASAAGASKILGFEANGGVLTGSPMQAGAAELTALPTRDGVLPLLAMLGETLAKGQPVSAFAARMRLPVADGGLIRAFPTETSKALLAELTADDGRRAAFFAPFGAIARLDLTDGLRALMSSGAIIHLRPSGNAPEMRCYVEAGSAEEARELSEAAMARVGAWVSATGGAR